MCENCALFTVFDDKRLDSAECHCSRGGKLAVDGDIRAVGHDKVVADDERFVYHYRAEGAVCDRERFLCGNCGVCALVAFAAKTMYNIVYNAKSEKIRRKMNKNGSLIRFIIEGALHGKGGQQ